MTLWPPTRRKQMAVSRSAYDPAEHLITESRDRYVRGETSLDHFERDVDVALRSYDADVRPTIAYASAAVVCQSSANMSWGEASDSSWDPVAQRFFAGLADPATGSAERHVASRYDATSDATASEKMADSREITTPDNGHEDHFRGSTIPANCKEIPANHTDPDRDRLRLNPAESPKNETTALPRRPHATGLAGPRYQR